MNKVIVNSFFLATLVASSSILAAGTGQTLMGDQEVPPVSTAASARCDIVVGSDMAVSGSIDTTGIEGTAAHIHAGAQGVNGPVVVKLAKTADNHWAVPAGTKLTSSQYESYMAGNLYVNVHSAAHANGEIRLQLKP